MNPENRPQNPQARPPSPGAPSSSYSPETDVHILDRIAVLYRYRRIALAVFVLTAAAMTIQGYSNVQMYRAQGRLLIEQERATEVTGIGSSAGEQFYEDPEPYFQTQYKILRGRDLTRRVIKKVKLDQVPEFNGTAKRPDTPLTLLSSARTRLMNMIWRREEAPQEAPKIDETPDESALVSAFIGRVSVDPVRGSRLVDISFDSVDPKFAADAANALMQEYVDQNLQSKQAATENMLEWLTKELSNQQAKVEDSERALAEYRDKQNAMSLDDKQNIVGARLNQLNDAATKAKMERVQKETAYTQIKPLLAAGSAVSADQVPITSQTPQMTQLRAKVTELQQQKVQLSQKYGDKHPSMIAINAQISETQSQLTLETQKALLQIKNDYDSAVLAERTYAQNLDAAKADVQDLNKKSVGYNVMEREAKSNRNIYESLLQKEKEMRVSSNSRSNNVRIVDNAEVPRSPLAAAGRRTWLTSIFIGLVLAVGVAFGLDYMNDTIKTPEDVTRRLKLPFLGLVPSVRGDKHPVLASAHVPHDFGEAFRSLRTSLMSRFPAEGTKILVVTSAQPLEGKTTTACNIAMALAYGGSRVLLVDADMRRPGMHRPLRLTNERGLSQVLIGQARVRDVIQRTVDPNLLAITAGRTPPNPSELLGSERMKTLLSNLSHGPFDWIVLDTPPVLAVTDAVILAPLVNGVCFVIGAEMTRRRLAERALETIMSAPPRFAAVVLNKVDFARNKYYYSRYYGHQYKNYYAEAAS
ncbi:MAG TPA: polysaccharide biosynthesis tyrosine autokinase [Vicinamibacterales bacterium]|nr:polysaccharide biosynthesis tyrosine autokinase [Vicinamibacterales bacterium]